jgi:hypothetical protein
MLALREEQATLVLYYFPRQAFCLPAHFEAPEILLANLPFSLYIRGKTIGTFRRSTAPLLSAPARALNAAVSVYGFISAYSNKH